MNIQITLVTPNGDITNLTFDKTNTIGQLYANVARKLNLRNNSFIIIFNTNPLKNQFQNLVQAGIKNGDIIQIQALGGGQPQQNQQQPNFAAAFNSGAGRNNGGGVNNNALRLRQEAEGLRTRYLNNQSELNMLLERDPEMAQAILSDDIQDTMNFIVERKQKIQRQKMRKIQEDQRLNNDPFNIEAQREIEKRIKNERMNQQLEYAHENMPESFIRTTMLYIPMSVNGKSFQAFVDSGAQSTIMSKAFAQRCGLMKNVDTRYKGTAVGVGSTAIIGRIHVCKLEVNGKVIECSIQVLDQGDVQMLFGLDMLKKHRCCINLMDHVLEFRAHGFSVPFLKDHQIFEGLVESKIFKAKVIGQKGMRALKSGGKASDGGISLEDRERKIRCVMREGATRMQAEGLLEEFGWDRRKARAVYLKKKEENKKGTN